MMIEWIWRNIDSLSALSAVLVFVGPVVWWLANKMIMSKKRYDQFAELMAPREGPSLRETLQLLLSGQSTLAKEFQALKSSQDGLKVGQQGMIARQRALLQDEETPLFETSIDGAHTFANQAYLDLVERQLDQIKGRGWEVIIHPEDRDRVVREWEAAVDAKRTYEATFRIVSRFGKTYRVKCVAKPLICEANVITGYLGKYVKVEGLAT